MNEERMFVICVDMKAVVAYFKALMSSSYEGGFGGSCSYA
jgi:hypothetical protein